MTFRTLLVSVLSLFFGLLFPAYGSITAIESLNSGDDTQWLVYWLIFSLLSISESLLWPVLKWLPLYQELKIVLIAWLVLPQTKGATWVYEAGLHPAWQFIRRELSKNPSIKNALDKAGGPALTSGSGSHTGRNLSQADRKQELETTLLDAATSLESQLAKIYSTSDSTTKTRAERDFDRTLSKLKKLQKAA